MRALPTPHPSRAGRRLAGAALTVAVAGITTTPVFAADAGNIEVSPSPARAGSTVTLSTVACGPGGSAGIDASSLGGGIIGLEPQDAESGTAEGSLRIPPETKPGNYAVGGSCTDGRELTGMIVVGDAQRMAAEKNAPAKEKPAQEKPAKDEAVEQEPVEHEPTEDGPMKKEPAAEASAGEPHERAVKPDMHHGKGEAPDRPGRDHRAPDDHAHHPQHEWAPHERGDGHHAAGPRAGRHGTMPHGRVHTGVGGGTDGMNTAQLAGGSAALTAAAGSVLYLRRRGRKLGH